MYNGRKQSTFNIKKRKQSIDNIKNLDETTLQYLMSGLLMRLASVEHLLNTTEKQNSLGKEEKKLLESELKYLKEAINTAEKKIMILCEIRILSEDMKHKKEIVGIFKGTDGSLGFKYNKTYRFKIFKALVNNDLLLLKTTEGLSCYYNSIEGILNNWDIISNDAVFKDERHDAIYWGDFLKEIEGNDTHHQDNQDNWDDF